MSEWETTAPSEPAAAPVVMPRNWLVTGALGLLAAGVALGAGLLGDVGEVPCHEVRDESIPLEQQLYETSDIRTTAADLARVANEHPGCFEPSRLAKLELLASEGPPSIGVLQRPRNAADELPPEQRDGQLDTEQARLARRTEAGSFYVTPKRGPEGSPAVCLVFLPDDDGSSISCSIPGVSMLNVEDVDASVVLTMGIHGPSPRGLAGIVGNGVSEVLVDGVPVEVEGNVFVAPDAPSDASIETHATG